MDTTTHVLDFDGRKIWMRRFGYKKAMLTTADERLKSFLVNFMKKNQDGSVEPLVDLDEFCQEDLEGAASFIVDTDRVQLLIDLGLFGIGIMHMKPDEEDGEPDE
jgi:hypothetical protein